VATVLAFFAAAYYAHIADKQKTVMEQQRDVAVSAIKTAQRARIKVTAAFPAITSGQPLGAVFTIENIGGTTAVQIDGNVYIELIPNSLDAPVFHYPLPQNIVAGAIFPGDPAQASLVRRSGKDVAHSVIVNVTEEETTSLNTGHAWVAIYGTIKYVDVFKDHHWTKFCYPYVPSVTPPDGTSGVNTRSCIAYNGVDDM
jgi:hypothetical protein